MVDPLFSAVLVLPVVLSAVRLHWLSMSGAVAAFAVGWVTLAVGSWQAASVLLAFFITSSALSRRHAKHKWRMEVLGAQGAQRGASQVLANGGVASLCIFLYGWTGEVHWWLAFAGACAAANADTWSSEIGMLSSQPPRHILTGRLLRAGDSGGVTPLGLLAGGMGSAVVAGVAWFAHPMPLWQILAIGWGGVVGNLLDSVLGGILQAKYQCARCGERIEHPKHCGLPAPQVAGWRWIDNDLVNLLCTLAGAWVGFLATKIHL